MAQRQFINYKEDDSSFLLNIKDLGIAGPGLYRGFDPETLPASLMLTLSHTETGYTEVNLAGDESVPLGLVKTRQGVLITEDAAKEIFFSAGDATHPRIDLVVLEHSYVEVPGGTPATYSVIEGTPAASPVAPSLPSPETMVILGRLTVPAGMAALSDAGVSYQKEPVPLTANDPTIVRNFGNQNIAGNKTFASVLAGAGEAVYSAQTISTESDSNYLHLPFQGSVSYLDVTALSLVTTPTDVVKQVRIFTEQKLRIISDASLLLPGLASEMYLSETDEIDVWCITGLGLGADYMVMKAGSVTSATNKFFDRQSWTKGGPITVTGTNQNIVLAGGNFISVTAASAITSVVRILGNNAATASPSRHDGGTVYFVRVSAGSPGNKLRLLHGGSVSGAFKPFDLQDGLSFDMEDGSMAVLVEDTASFRVAAYFRANDPAYGLIQPVGPTSAALTYATGWSDEPGYPLQYKVHPDKTVSFVGKATTTGAGLDVLTFSDLGGQVPYSDDMRFILTSHTGLGYSFRLYNAGVVWVLTTVSGSPISSGEIVDFSQLRLILA